MVVALEHSFAAASSLPGYGGCRPLYVRQHVTQTASERQRPVKFSQRSDGPTLTLSSAGAAFIANNDCTAPAWTQRCSGGLARTTYRQQTAPLPDSAVLRCAPKAAVAPSSAASASPSGQPGVAAAAAAPWRSLGSSKSEYAETFGAAALRPAAGGSCASDWPLCSASSGGPSLCSLPFAANLLRSSAAYGLYTRGAADYAAPLPRTAGQPSLAAMCSTRDLQLGTAKASDGRTLPGYCGHQPYNARAHLSPADALSTAQWTQHSRSGGAQRR